MGKKKRERPLAVTQTGQDNHLGLLGYVHLTEISSLYLHIEKDSRLSETESAVMTR